MPDFHTSRTQTHGNISRPPTEKIKSVVAGSVSTGDAFVTPRTVKIVEELKAYGNLLRDITGSENEVRIKQTTCIRIISA